MRGLMAHVLDSFLGATGWDRDNNYSELNATANELISFPLPHGVRLTLSSLATPHFGTSYLLGSAGTVEGSIAYLYSSVPLHGIVPQSDRIPLPTLLRSYRQLHEFTPSSSAPTTSAEDEPTPSFEDARTVAGELRRHERTENGTLLFGRLYLPRSLLECLVIKRLTPALQVQISAVSQQSLKDGGTVLGQVIYDKKKYSVEGLGSSDGGLLGVRGVYNFGGDAAPSAAASPSEASAAVERERERIYGRFTAGGELYYGTLNKSGGMSVGARFATLPTHRGTPLMATLTINPLMGNISATYAVVAHHYCSLATKMEFNVYSYESDWAVGVELWSKRRPGPKGDAELISSPSPSVADVVPPTRPIRKERSFQAKLEWRLDDEDPPATVGDGQGHGSVTKKDEYLGVLKARLDQHLRLGFLWEGRVKSLLFSLGSGVDLRQLDQPFRSLGLEVQYSS